MKAKKNYGYARLINVLTPSKDRISKICGLSDGKKMWRMSDQEMNYPETACI